MVSPSFPSVELNVYNEVTQLSGICRGCGWQKIGAYVNLGSYYLVGIPSAIVLAFLLHVGGRVNELISYIIYCCSLAGVYSI